ncbi:ATP-binding cassette domain-containing protein [Desulfurivibrio sp. D14AmB]|uniref:ATP-binding cassette domain-containing protein n=1 Tax=Desulfurivibrio sp. D14AmB TaxID=3374370 RepID=UPI00376EFBF8
MNLTIHDLNVTYQSGGHRLTALEEVSLRLTPGRITGLVGESGSGKTSLGKALLGLLPENADFSGSIRLGELELVGADEERLNAIRWQRIARVPQNGAASLNPVHRLGKQVAEPLLAHRGLSWKETGERVAAALARVGLSPELARRFPHEISGGELQRAMLAMALILEPEFVILDEPTAALDAVNKGLIGELIRHCAERGAGVLLISHDLQLVNQLADELAVLYLGQVMETMPGPDLLTDPRHPYTLALARSYPGRDTHRDLGGIRGDALYRVIHRHREPGSATPHDHAHLVGSATSHADCHLPARGCLFQTRCTQAVAACAREEVTLRGAGEHQVRCLRGGIAVELELRGICKSYGQVAALHPTDLSLRAGETYCLVGESGSGKSTLALLATGLLEPDRGRRIFQGRELTRWLKEDRRGLARRIGLIQQHPARAVSHRLTVAEIVAEPLRLQRPELNPAERQQLVEGALRDVHLTAEPEFLTRYPHELNLGALQRVCIARALVGNPELLVADEPTSALDPGVQAKVLKLLLDLQIERGLTMLFITHDLGLARKIADRIGVMRAGRLVEEGPAARLLNHPTDPYTRRLWQCGAGNE